MAFNLSASLKSNLTSAVNTIKTSVSTVSQNISTATGVSTQKINSALLGGAIGGLVNGGRGAALGALAGGILGGGGAGDLLGQVKNKLGGLISAAEELQGLANNPLKLVERGMADLAGITGEEYGLVQSQYRELNERSAFSDFVDSGYKSPYEGDDTSASRIPNPLRNHNSFNYVVSLGVLDAAEYNNPESYRSAGGFKNYVIQSSGGNLDKRYQVFDETGSGKSEHAEYYIDDLEIEAVVSPNPNTRVTAGTALTFNVTEPYSMGNFIQAIIGAAATAGYKSYTQAPFCLKIDFKGWNLDGSTDANFLTRPIFIPIKFINMDFNVSGTGSTYAVKAVPMSESGLADNINKLKTSIKATGLFLHQVLETNDASITSAINGQIQGLEEAGALAPYDRYIIAFPKDRDTLQSALQTGNIDDTAFTTSPEEREEQRRGTVAANPELRGIYQSQSIIIKPPSRTYSILKSFAENTSLMNEIGLSTLNEDTNAPGNSSEADTAAATNPETGLVDTASKAVQPADKARDFQFNQNENITSIIEKIVVQSTFCAENSTIKAKNGLHKWFKIHTHVFIDESPVTEAQMGRRPKVYVYSIMPYEVPETVTMASNARASNIQGLKRVSVKEYNYIYTGKNEDVLNFDINFNNAFMLTANSDFGMTSGSQSDPDSSKVATSQTNSDSGATPAEPSDTTTTDDAAGGTQMDTGPTGASGTHSNDVRRQIAEMFHDRITNMTVDMVTAEMEIMGDPYYLPQDSGNYVSKRVAGKPGITEDGTMPYSTGPVLVDVNFRTPFDYQVDGATMEMPLAVPGFSGLFQVWAVTNMFSGGKFTQRLKMMRLRGQDDRASTGNTNFIQVNNNAAMANTTTQSDGTVGASGMTSTNCMPGPVADDIRNLMPAVGDDVAAALTAQVRAIESSLATGFAGIADVVPTIGAVPDLTKVIPRIASIAAGGLIGNALGGRLGAVAGAALGSQLGSPGGLNSLTGSLTSGLSGLEGGLNSAFNSLGDPNAPPYTGDDPIIRARLGLPAVNTAAAQGIAATSGAATSRVRNLLG
jgi:hypothetical protein